MMMIMNDDVICVLCRHYEWLWRYHVEEWIDVHGGLEGQQKAWMVQDDDDDDGDDSDEDEDYDDNDDVNDDDDSDDYDNDNDDSNEGDDDGDDSDEDDEDEDYDNVYMLIGGYFAVWTVRSMLAASKKVLGQAGASCPMRMGTNTLVRRE